MQAINHTLVIAFYFTSLLFGAALNYLAPEEVEEGITYIRYMEKGILAISLLPPAYFFINSSLLLSAVFIFAIPALITLEFPYRIAPLYVLSVVLMLSFSEHTMYYTIQASIMFLYGFPAGTLIKDYYSA